MGGGLNPKTYPIHTPKCLSTKTKPHKCENNRSDHFTNNIIPRMFFNKYRSIFLEIFSGILRFQGICIKFDHIVLHFWAFIRVSHLFRGGGEGA